MPRSTAELLAQIEQFVPGYYETGEALLAGFAATAAVAEASAATLRPLATIGGADGMWLSMQASGHGIYRSTSEPDASLRKRLRHVEDQVTKSAIEAAVNSIIGPDTCRVVEWFSGPYLDNEGPGGLWLDNSDALLSGGPQSFLVLIPEQDTGFAFGPYLDSMFLDDPNESLGEGPEDPVYTAIVNEVERIRAAGVFWRLVLES
ncbi:MAG: hypothetical protein ABL912_01940 [Novosphingobium sp.]